MKHTQQKLTALALIAAFPVIASAETFHVMAGRIVGILKGLAGVIFASLVVGIILGVVMFMANSENEKKREEIKGYLLWAIIGIAVVFGLWGILAILSATMGWGDVGIPIIRPPQ